MKYEHRVKKVRDWEDAEGEARWAATLFFNHQPFSLEGCHRDSIDCRNVTFVFKRILP